MHARACFDSHGDAICTVVALFTLRRQRHDDAFCISSCTMNINACLKVLVMPHATYDCGGFSPVQRGARHAMPSLHAHLWIYVRHRPPSVLASSRHRQQHMGTYRLGARVHARHDVGRQSAIPLECKPRC